MSEEGERPWVCGSSDEGLKVPRPCFSWRRCESGCEARVWVSGFESHFYLGHKHLATIMGRGCGLWGSNTDSVSTTANRSEGPIKPFESRSSDLLSSVAPSFQGFRTVFWVLCWEIVRQAHDNCLRVLHTNVSWQRHPLAWPPNHKWTAINNT